MNFVIDTNVMNSSLLKKNTPPYKVVRMALSNENRLFYTYPILDEYRRVLESDKFPFTDAVKENFLHLIERIGVAQYSITYHCPKPMKDETDGMFYELAKTFHCFF